MAEGTERYRVLKQAVTDAGILDRAYTFYAVLFTTAMAGYLLSLAGIVLAESYLWLTLACLAFSFFTVQLAGLMHDCGHRAVFKSRRANDVLGFICAASIGMILASWRHHHNQHHAFPNQENRDPDYKIPLIALNPVQLAAKTGLGRVMARYQAMYFYLIVASASLSNRLGGMTYFIKHRSRENILNIVAYVPVTILVFAGPFVFFSLEKALFVSVFVHLVTGFYLANCFAPNHKGMAMIDEHEEISFVEQQIITARDVRGGTWCDILLVGLNHQIEHHLFPRTPRIKLARIKPHVKALCAEVGIPYREAGLIEGTSQIVSSLHHTSRTDRKLTQT